VTMTSIKLERKDSLSEYLPLWQQLHHSASVTTGDGNILVLDLLKLSMLSPFIKGVLDTFSIPSSLNYLLDVNIILPDFSPDTLAVLVEVLEGTAAKAGNAVIGQVRSLVNILGHRVGLLKDGEKVNSVKSVLPRVVKAKTAECKPESNSIKQHKESKIGGKSKFSFDSRAGASVSNKKCKGVGEGESRTVRYAGNASHEQKKWKKGLKSKSAVKDKTMNRIKRRVNEERSRRDKVLKNSLSRLQSGVGEDVGYGAREYRIERVEREQYQDKMINSQRFNCYDVDTRQFDPKMDEMEFCGDGMREYDDLSYVGGGDGFSFGGQMFGVGGPRNNSFGGERIFQAEYCHDYREGYVPRRGNFEVDSYNYRGQHRR